MAIFPVDRPVFTIQMIHNTPNVSNPDEQGVFAAFDVAPHRWTVDPKVGGMDEALLSVLATYWWNNRWGRNTLTSLVQEVDLPGISCKKGGLVAVDASHPLPHSVRATAYGTHLSITGGGVEASFPVEAFGALHYHPAEVRREREELDKVFSVGNSHRPLASALMGAASVLDGASYASTARFVHDGKPAYVRDLLEAVGGRVARLLVDIEQSGTQAIKKGEKFGGVLASMLPSAHLLHTDRLWMPRAWTLQDGWALYAAKAQPALFEAGRVAAAAALPYTDHLRHIHHNIALSGHARVACKAAAQAIDQAFSASLLRAGLPHLLIPSARKTRA